MKKIKIVGFLLLLSVAVSAQDTEIIDSLDISADSALAFALAPLNTAPISSGFWKDKTLDLGDMLRFDGSSNATSSDILNWELPTIVLV